MELFARIDTAKAQLDAMRPLDREREDRAMQKFRLWWTYHSNAIEGNSLTQGETEVFLMEGLTAKGKPLKDHLDLQGHNEAVNFLLSFVKDAQPITETDIRGLHKLLLVNPYLVPAVMPDGTPTTKMVAVGEYKTSANHVRTRTGEIHYYATPEETPAKMHKLIEWFRSAVADKKTHLVEIVARFHHRFTAIHPFDDGNGRMSRLLMNLMLMQAGYPPVIIRLEERDQYLVALQQADAGEYQEFVAFVGEHVADSLELFARAARGEDISETTDLRKEIRLELLRLKQNREPEKRTYESFIAVFTGSILPLVKAISAGIADFCDAFTESSIDMQVNASEPGLIRGYTAKSPILNPDFTSFISQNITPEKNIVSSKTTFNCKGFRRGGYNIFDLSASLEVKFEELKYSLQINSRPSLQPITRFYQEPVSPDEMRQHAEAMARYFLEAIRQKTKA